MARSSGIVALGLAVGLLACGTPELSPEAEVRETLAALESAAEAGDASAFTELVSPAYEDPYGHDREKLKAFLSFHVMRSGRGREVVVRVREIHIEPSDPTRAVVTLSLGLMGSGARLSADVYAVDMDLVREEETWRVAWAQWRSAPAADLL
jgi:hypothetical protein